ncbi:hypothetical protein PsYK624_146200 [Phanerochaete sordida]|uniref:Uncharacterized protein n=1 Tax=Phanerochaete sordida TaxID=48140 RepID=A0A9P3GNS5_9APHY|nr:hypothetical protein PsYK624_146200 [Phanerochaete sordida]
MLDADHFATLLRMTPNVHKLFLSDIWLIFPDYFVYPAYRTSLLHLELSYPSFEPSSSDMVCLLRFFEDIRLLTWRHCGLTHMEYMTHPSALPPPPVVKQLTVEGIDVEAAEFDNLPANLIDFDHLERVELVPNGPFYAIYYDVLEKAASTMRHLRMYLVQGYGADGYGTPARLVSNALRGPRLEELLLEIDLKLPYVAYSIETLAEVLSAAQITANQFPALRRLVLIFHFDRDTHELPEPEPEELDLDFETDIDRMLVEIVSQSHAAKIECRWHELYNPLGEDLEACLRKIFPRLIEQKALELIQIPAQDPR